MSFDGIFAVRGKMAAIILAIILSGCGSGGPAQLASSSESLSHNKFATKVLAKIAVARVTGSMPTRVARAR